MRRLTLCLLLLVSFGVAQAAAAPPQWLAHESWPGGRQYDARLERTVTFWGTGVPAAAVFTSITKQTGVALGFFPPGDDNARLCLNLYLNPKQPPTLRDLLAQIGWTMDCAWAVEGEGEQRRYLLLHTSIGDGVFERIRQESDAAARRRGEEESKALRERSVAAAAKLPELGGALRLSREVAIERYRGADDAMLLILLDPARRAAAQLFLSLPESDPQAVDLSSGVSRKWEELTPEQQAWAEETLGPKRAERAQGMRQGRWPPPEPDEPPLPRTPWDLSVSFYGTDGGLVMDVVGRNEARKAAGRGYLLHLHGADLILCRDPRLEADAEGKLWDGIALRRLLGEEVDENEGLTSAADLGTHRQFERQRALVEQQLASRCRLSREATDRLATLRLPVEMGREYALWQLQEAVAARSGMHVISDHFGQPVRCSEEVLSLVHPDQEPGQDALSLLQASCTAINDREQLRGGGLDQLWTVARWEWGDAGQFLRFRSADRDAWRAAFLPAEVVATLDGWLAPHLPAHLAEAKEATVPLDVRRVGALLARLDTMQRLWGGALTYGSPLDETEQWRRSFRLAFAQVTQQWGPPLYLMLSGLDDAQWEQAHAEGLRVGVDFTPRPDPAEDPWGRPPRDWLESWQGQILRIGPPETRTTQKRIGQDPIDEWCRVEVRPEGAPPGERYLQTLATQLTIHPERLPHLVAPP